MARFLKERELKAEEPVRKMIPSAFQKRPGVVYSLKSMISRKMVKRGNYEQN